MGVEGKVIQIKGKVKEWMLRGDTKLYSVIESDTWDQGGLCRGQGKTETEDSLRKPLTETSERSHIGQRG